MPTEKSFTFRIPVDLFKQIEQLAQQQDLSVAQLVRKALREYSHIQVEQK